MKSVILLEGGSYRGIYTSGVLDVWMEHGIYPDCVVGVSAGALNAMCYVAHQPGRSKDVIYAYGLDPRYLGKDSLRHEHNMVGFDFILHTVPKFIPFDEKTFHTAPTKFYAAVTNCKTGAQEYIDRDTSSNIMDAIAASASMPFLNHNVPLNGTPYLDGGIAHKTPLHFLDEHPEYDRAIMILTRERTYQKAETSPLMKKAAQRAYRNFPAIAKELCNERRLFEQERQRIFQLEKEGKLLVIAPEQALGIKRLEKNMDALCTGYQTGRKDGLASVQAVQEYLQK